MRSANRRTIRWLGARVRLAWVAAIAVVVLFGASARAGSSYLYCRAMHEVRDEPCCANAAPRASVIEATPCRCCQRRLTDAVPRATPVVAPDLARRSLASMAAFPRPSTASVRLAASRPQLTTPPPRAGAPPSVDLVRLRVQLR